MDVTSILNAAGSYAAGSVANGAASSATVAAGSDSPAAAGDLTISQARDMFDGMANAGELTTQEQMQLISAGLQDPNAENPSYQPTGQVGYQRSDTATYSVDSLLNGYAGFAGNATSGFTDPATGEFTSNAAAWTSLLAQINAGSTESTGTSVDVLA